MNNEKLYKMFKEEHPETIGEKDQCFDTDNYKDWLEEYVIKLEIKLSERQAISDHSDKHEQKALHITDVSRLLPTLDIINERLNNITGRTTESNWQYERAGFQKGINWALNYVNNKAKTIFSNDTIHSITPCLSNIREQYLEETKNDTKIEDLKPMFQNYQSIREKETLQFIEYATYHGINLSEMLDIKLTKEEAQHLLNCLIRTSAKGKDLDIGMKIERLLSIFVKTV